MFYGGSVLQKDFVENEKGTGFYPFACAIHYGLWAILLLYAVPFILLILVAFPYFLYYCFTSGPAAWCGVALGVAFCAGALRGLLKKPTQCSDQPSDDRILLKFTITESDE